MEEPWRWLGWWYLHGEYTSLVSIWHVLFTLPGMCVLQTQLPFLLAKYLYPNFPFLSEASTDHATCGRRLLRWPPMMLIPWPSCPCIIPAPGLSDSHLRKRMQEGRDVTSEIRLQIVCGFLASSFLLSHLLNLREASCHVVSSPLQRLKWQGSEVASGHEPVRSWGL